MARKPVEFVTPSRSPEIGFSIPIVSDVWDGVTDVTSSVWDRIPGSEYVDAATRNLVSGPLKDFAKTSVGHTILTAVASTAGMAAMAVPFVGPAIMVAAWSIPGLARGEPFDQAFTKEFIYRVQRTIEYFAGDLGDAAGKEVGKQMGDGFQMAINSLKEEAQKSFPGLSVDEAMRQLNISPQQLAARLNIREDVAAYVLELVKRGGDAALAAINSNYDIKTGKKTTISLGKRTVSTGPSQFKTPCEAYNAALKAKPQPSAAVMNALKAKCSAYQLANITSKPPSASMSIATAIKTTTTPKPAAPKPAAPVVTAASKLAALQQQRAFADAMPSAEEVKSITNKSPLPYILGGLGVLLAGGGVFYAYKRGWLHR